MIVADDNPQLLFYTYTKSLNYWIARKDFMPSNLRITASMGGRLDHLIQEHNLKHVRVVTSPEEAKALNLQLDHDDTHAMYGDNNFALLIHGTQKAGSDMGKAKAALRKRGIMGYQRTTKKPNRYKKLVTA